MACFILVEVHQQTKKWFHFLNALTGTLPNRTFIKRGLYVGLHLFTTDPFRKKNVLGIIFFSKCIYL